jgi:predicted kinase
MSILCGSALFDGTRNKADCSTSPAALSQRRTIAHYRKAGNDHHMDDAPATSPAPLLLIVTGASGAGKTTLARKLAHALALPLASRDAIKERLFDTLGTHDHSWSRQLGQASYPLLYYALELLLAARASCIVESNFDPRWATGQLLELRRRHPFQALQIICTVHPSERLVRTLGRTLSGARHPGHADYTLFVRFPWLRPALFAQERLRLTLAPPADLASSWELPIGGGCLCIDTARLDEDGFAALVDAIRPRLQALLSW